MTHAEKGFAFFGRDPQDWYEGANMGHRFSVCFAEVPDEEALRQIAESVVAAPFGQWGDFRWAGRVLMFRVGGYGMTFMPKIHAWARALHSERPIVDVVFHGIREGDPGPGEPAPAADMSLALGLRRKLDPAAPPFAPQPAFDAVLAEAAERRRAATRSKELDKALKKQKIDGPIVFEVAEAMPSDSWSQEIATKFVLREPATYRRDVGRGRTELKHHAGDTWAGGPAQFARPVAWVHDEDDDYADLAFLDDAGERQQLGLPRLPGAAVSVAPEGNRGLVCRRLVAFEADFATGSHQPMARPAPHEELKACALLAEGAQAVLTTAALYLLDAEGDVRWTKTMQAFGVRALAQGRGVAVTDKRGVSFWAFSPHKLTRVAAFGLTGQARSQDGDLWLSTAAGPLVARCGAIAIAEQAAKARATKKKDLGVVTLRFEPVTEVSFRDHVTDDRSARERLPAGAQAGARVVASPSGDWIAFDREGGKEVWVHQVSTGSTTRALIDLTTFFPRDDGQLVATGFGYALWRHRGEPDASEWPGLMRQIGHAESVDYLPELDALCVAGPGRFAVYTASPGGISEVWTAAGFRRAALMDGAVVVADAEGRCYRVLGLAEALRRMQSDG